MKTQFHILLVDDSDIIARRVPEIFREHENISITIVKDTISAGEFISSVNVDLVLLDISLNGFNGLELLKEFHQNGISIPVVMLTNQATRKHRQICKNLGCYDFLDKSTEFDRLIPVVKSLMNQR